MTFKQEPRTKGEAVDDDPFGWNRDLCQGDIRNGQAKLKASGTAGLTLYDLRRPAADGLPALTDLSVEFPGALPGFSHDPRSLILHNALVLDEPAQDLQRPRVAICFRIP